MQNPDLEECPEYPTGYCYFYNGEPWIDGVCKTKGGGQMHPGHLTGQVLFAGNPGEEVTLKLTKIYRRDLSIITYPDEITNVIPKKEPEHPLGKHWMIIAIAIIILICIIIGLKAQR